MLPVYICEDIPARLEMLRKIIEKHIESEQLDMKVVCAATGPDEVISHLRKHPENSLYFLDIDLKTDRDGFGLAKEIRRYDPNASIVIVTTHAELSLMAFRYHIQAMDFIIKEEVKEFGTRVRECLLEACRLYGTEPEGKLVLGSGLLTYTFDADRIYFISAGEHKVEIHEENAITNIPCTLGYVQELLDENFYRCHRSYLVNTQHIINIDMAECVAVMDNGTKCPVSRREIRNLKRLAGRRKI